MKCLQQLTRAQTVTEVIGVRLDRNYKSYINRSSVTPRKVHYKTILFYSALFLYSYIDYLTNTNKHSSVPKYFFSSNKRPRYFFISSSFF